MRRLPLLVLLVFASGARGQVGPVAHADRAGGPGTDTASGVVADLYGYVTMVGTISGTATFGAITVEVDETGCMLAACHDGYAAMYAPDGELLWVHRMGASDHDDSTADVAFVGTYHQFQPDVLVSGTFSGQATWDGGSNADVALTSRGDSDAFLAKYTASGDLEWVLQAGETDRDAGHGVAGDYEGYTYWTGSFRDVASIGSGSGAYTLTSDGSSDGFVARVDPDGTLAWVTQIGGQGTLVASDVVVSSIGEPFITATFDGIATLGSTQLESRGFSDGVAAKLYGQTGNAEWIEQIGGEGDDHLRRITVDDYGQVAIVAGSFSGSLELGQDVLMSAGETDALVVALGGYTGRVLWARRAGGAGADAATGVGIPSLSHIVTLDGNSQTEYPVFVTGSTIGSPTFDSEVPGSLETDGRDGFFAAYVLDGFKRPPGDLITVLLIGGPGDDEASGVTATVSELSYPPSADPGSTSFYAVVAGGSFQQSAQPFGESIQSEGGTDAFFAKQSTCSDLFCFRYVSEEPSPEASSVTITLAPHPASGSGSTLTVSIDAPGDLRIDLFDARGRRIAALADGPRASGEHRISLPPSLRVRISFAR